MATLNKRDRERIIKLLETGEDLPLDYKHILFPPEKKEYELVYAGKEREEDILADTMAVPLQPIKTFGVNGNVWTNKLIFGDNLQVMKSLLDDPEVKGQVKLIYIDPPFATKQEFRGSQDQKAYQDKIAGAQFVEFLRKRLVFLRELLANDGLIYVHLDQKKGHYIKVIMDEVFGESNFLNEIIWKYVKFQMRKMNRFVKNSDRLLIYSKTPNYNFYSITYKLKEPKKLLKKGWDKELGRIQNIKDENGKTQKITIYDEKVDDVWKLPYIGATAKERIDYPTQKPEKVLKWVIKSATKENDLAIDVFAGSGTTLAVAEKLNRRWIGIDCGKLAIYTMQKRMLNLKTEIGNKGKKLKPKPFTLYHAGLYDFPKLKKLPWTEWRKFALLLFNCRDSRHTVSGIELDGYKGRSDVLVFDYQKDGGVVLDYGFIDDLHSMIGSKLGSHFFLIAPAASVTFLEDYIDKGSVRYYILRIPYSIINELHSKDFEAIKQPIDESQVNDTVDAVGFDFIRQPKVKCVYSIEKPKDQLLGYAVVKIKTFKSEAMLKGASQLANRESLSTIMIDFDYDGDVFNLDKVFYASDIEKNKWKVFLPKEEIKKQIMIIYLDIYGNEYREIKTLQDFTSSKKVKRGGK
ncbi:MAG: adenine-specific DNA-methyltransferase [Desulfobacteraceae bacterium Eth-SRB1]|nr:MAG: adenine-specific DNA-methyltransferase [Desulfobacteraceae bacterium Eth-SRB1]